MVLELMQEMGLYSIRTRAKAMYRDLRKHMGNRVIRNFNPDAPNKIWVSDVTEFNYKNVTIFWNHNSRKSKYGGRHSNFWKHNSRRSITVGEA